MLSALFPLGAAATPAAPSVAIFYGSNAPLDELKAFDIAIVEPGHNDHPERYRRPYSELYAYVSVGEAHPTRPYFKDIPAAAKLTENKVWGSVVIDLSHPAWPEFFANRIVAPLWEKGYRGFFLDTLDSYRGAPKFDEAAQQKGLVAVIETLHRRFPGIRLILNRGFEVVPAVKDKVQMVAAESLFRGWDGAAKRYVEVPAGDREWLLAQLLKVRDDYGIPVLAIDYVAPEDRALTRATAERIRALGIVPWVTDWKLESLGIGQVEVMPRKIIALYSGREQPAINFTNMHRFAEMPLNHLGYVLEYRDINDPLPDYPLAGRVAGIVQWVSGTPESPKRLASWLKRQTGAGIKVAIIGQLGIPPELAGAFGVAYVPTAGNLRLELVRRDKMIGLETEPVPDGRNFQPVRLAKGDGVSLLEMADQQGRRYDGAAIMPWGGFVLSPFDLMELPGTEQARWIVDPFAFLQQALRLAPVPVPDVTTENGRRLLFAHIDGDGFPSRAELPGTPLAGRALLDEILRRYPVPTTMSVIEAEISPAGLYPKDAPEMEDITRRIFALPDVEVASHTYSHPFRWDNHVKHGIFRDSDADEAYHLKIPGYKLDLEREIVGSMDYVRRLAPAGKPARILLWSGDTAPGVDALRIADEAGFLNMNGGDTVITRSNPSLTAVMPVGIGKGGYRQIYAPVSNENLYTNLWQGPYYGYQKVIETFEMTGAPRRLKPIDIYYHVYSASKKASLSALHKVYGWALGQPVHPVFGSEYIRKALDFYTAVVARDGDGWLYRGDGELRTLRVPASLGTPDLRASDVAGYAPGPEGNYLHLTGAEARVRFAPTPTREPFLRDANARLSDWHRTGDGISFKLEGHQPLALSFANFSGCRASADGKPVAPSRSGNETVFNLNHARASIQVRCQ
ncbi:MAG TPA: bifunctional glycoside hydrolase 114/ polysaccharide deacetylase family protein [Rhodocyclaceae bacterium]|nr:bifunctional glycoside hydrolase 114/ polysaccharide deacetylase family protein [Rhodocyclaceae bacterium]